MKDDVFVAEFSMTKLYELNTKPLKYKEASKYPEIKKDVAFVVDNSITNKEIETVIKKSGGRLLSNIDIFDIYREIEEGKKSMAYKLTFKDETRTLSDDEVMEVFNKIIVDVESKLNAKVRSN
jgi:phenylalanyl-tRNA synthetase beta chain